MHEGTLAYEPYLLSSLVCMGAAGVGLATWLEDYRGMWIPAAVLAHLLFGVGFALLAMTAGLYPAVPRAEIAQWIRDTFFAAGACGAVALMFLAMGRLRDWWEWNQCRLWRWWSILLRWLMRWMA